MLVKKAKCAFISELGEGKENREKEKNNRQIKRYVFIIIF
jgi:hypothetical protein